MQGSRRGSIAPDAVNSGMNLRSPRLRSQVLFADPSVQRRDKRRHNGGSKCSEVIAVEGQPRRGGRCRAQNVSDGIVDDNTGARERGSHTRSLPGRIGSELTQQRQHLLAQLGASSGGVGVGQVLNKGPLCEAADALAVEASLLKHGPHERGLLTGAAIADARQGSEGTASDEAHEQRFELVVGLMTGGNEGAAVFLGERGKGLVAHSAGIGFEIAAEVRAANRKTDERKRKSRGEACRCGLIAMRLRGGPDVMNNVGDHTLVGCRRQSECQRAGIRSAGAGDEGAAMVITDGGPAGQPSPGGDHAAD